MELEVPEYDPQQDPVGAAVLAGGGKFATPAKPNGGGGETEMIRNAAAVYGGRGDGGGAGTSGAGAACEEGANGLKDGGGELCYASLETWAGGRRDARVLFGEADGGKLSRRRSKGGTLYADADADDATHAPSPATAKAEEGAVAGDGGGAGGGGGGGDANGKGVKEEQEKEEEGVKEAAPAPTKLSKKARKMKKPCMPRPNME